MPDPWIKTTFLVTVESPERAGRSPEWDAQEMKFILDEHYTRPVEVAVADKESENA